MSSSKIPAASTITPMPAPPGPELRAAKPGCTSSKPPNLKNVPLTSPRIAIILMRPCLSSAIRYQRKVSSDLYAPFGFLNPSFMRFKGSQYPRGSMAPTSFEGSKAQAVTWPTEALRPFPCNAIPATAASVADMVVRTPEDTPQLCDSWVVSIFLMATGGRPDAGATHELTGPIEAKVSAMLSQIGCG